MPLGNFYPQFKLRQLNGNAINFDTDDIRVAILTASYTPSISDAFFSDIEANEVTGTNYIVGGTPVTGVTLALDGEHPEWAHNDIVWPASPSGFGNGRHFVWYKRTLSATTSPLILRLDAGGTISNLVRDVLLDGSDINGIFRLRSP